MRKISCNLCGSDQETLLYNGRDVLYRTTGRIFSVVQCNNCRLVSISPQPEPNEIPSFYPKNYHPYLGRSKGKIYREPTSPTKYVLDVGCGAGTFLERYHQKQPMAALYGVDFDPTACEVVSEKGFLVRKGSLTGAQFESDFFDELYMKHFLEHVTDPGEVLKESARILKKEGTLTIHVPNFRSISRMIFGRNWYGLDVPRHLFQYTPNTIIALVKKAGFAKCKISFHPTSKYFLRSLGILLYHNRWMYPKAVERLLAVPAWAIAKAGLSSEMRITAIK